MYLVECEGVYLPAKKKKKERRRCDTCYKKANLYKIKIGVTFFLKFRHFLFHDYYDPEVFVAPQPTNHQFRTTSADHAYQYKTPPASPEHLPSSTYTKAGRKKS